MLYDMDKTWRVRIHGAYDGMPALLRIENLKLETDEERVRAAFRAQSGGMIRPPVTFVSAPFDNAVGYAWSIDEAVGDQILFDPTGDPAEGARAFLKFYVTLRRAVRKPFLDHPQVDDAAAFGAEQAKKWTEIAQQRDPDVMSRHVVLLDRLRDRFIVPMRRKKLVFCHAHLSGWDVRIGPGGSYVVFANHFWSWRQPGYDIAFPIWGMWMALPPEQQTPEDVRAITDVWLQCLFPQPPEGVDLDERHPVPLDGIRHWVAPEDLRTMLLNRCFGSLILDLPAKRGQETHVDRLEAAVVAEAERLLAM